MKKIIHNLQNENINRIIYRDRDVTIELDSDRIFLDFRTALNMSFNQFNFDFSPIFEKLPEANVGLF